MIGWLSLLDYRTAELYLTLKLGLTLADLRIRNSDMPDYKRRGMDPQDWVWHVHHEVKTQSCGGLFATIAQVKHLADTPVVQAEQMTDQPTP